MQDNSTDKDLTSFIAATAIMQVSSSNIDGYSILHSISTMLNFGPGVDGSRYMENGVPNEEGTKAIILAFVHGIASTIKHAHRKGIMDESEHMRKVINMLGDAFARPSNEFTQQL